MAHPAPHPFHPYLLLCSCERTVQIERLGFAASGRMEALGTCVCGSVVRDEVHVVEVVAKAAAFDATGKPTGQLIHAVSAA